nr:hypothetical protein [uncultured Carboxylicivirga sp.]
MKSATFIFVSILSLFGFHSGIHNEPDWISSGQENGIYLFERWIDINDQLKVRERKGEFYSSCLLADAEFFLNDYKNSKQWMKGISKIEVINRQNEEIIYFVISLPWPFKNRDFTARYSCERINDKKSIIRLRNLKAMLPESNKYVHIKDYRASWLVEQVSPTMCKITFCTFSSEPPLFPQWIQEPVLKKLFFKNLERLQNCLNEL